MESSLKINSQSEINLFFDEFKLSLRIKFMNV